VVVGLSGWVLMRREEVGKLPIAEVPSIR
jgi:hypothetical protein